MFIFSIAIPITPVTPAIMQQINNMTYTVIIHYLAHFTLFFYLFNLIYNTKAKKVKKITKRKKHK